MTQEKHNENELPILASQKTILASQKNRGFSKKLKSCKVADSFVWFFESRAQRVSANACARRLGISITIQKEGDGNQYRVYRGTVQEIMMEMSMK